MNTSELWEVARWSGRQTDCWIPKFETYSESEARARFQAEHEKMRQGAVELRRGDKVIKRTIAPTLRRYW